MKYNVFEIRVDPANYIEWPGGGGFQPVDIYIDGRFLIDIIREVEKSVFALKEEENSERPAGDYISLNKNLTFLPNRNLLGEHFTDHPFVIEPDNIHRGKSILLQCSCGITECWFLAAKITVTETTVEWSRLGQFHRNYEYGLQAFVFDREQYEQQLNRK